MPLDSGARGSVAIAALKAFARAAWAGLLFGLAASVVGFGFGVLRVVFVTPATGPVGAVLLELMIFLPLLWWAAGRICDWMTVRARDALFMVGLTALATLLSLEAGFAMAVIKISFQDYIDGIASPAGLIGLAGQAMLAWFPALHREMSANGRQLTVKTGQNAEMPREWSWPRSQH